MTKAGKNGGHGGHAGRVPLPGMAHMFSPRNIRYCRDFYVLYEDGSILPQAVAKSGSGRTQAKVLQDVAELILVPWGHHRTIIALNTPDDNAPIGVLICKEHNRVLAKFHLEKLGLSMGISGYEIKKVLPTPAQLAKCYADAEAQLARNAAKRGGHAGRVTLPNGECLAERVPPQNGNGAVGSRVPRARGGVVGSRVPRDRKASAKRGGAR